MSLPKIPKFDLKNGLEAILINVSPLICIHLRNKDESSFLETHWLSNEETAKLNNLYNHERHSVLSFEQRLKIQILKILKDKTNLIDPVLVEVLEMIQLYPKGQIPTIKVVSNTETGWMLINAHEYIPGTHKLWREEDRPKAKASK
jgi:hypothetical protein